MQETQVTEEQLACIENAMRGWDSRFKADVRECQNYLAAGMMAAGACLMGAVWALASWTELANTRHPFIAYKVPSWAWLMIFVILGAFFFISAKSLFLRLEGHIRSAHQFGLRMFMEQAKLAGVRLRMGDVLALLSDPRYLMWSI